MDIGRVMADCLREVASGPIFDVSKPWLGPDTRLAAGRRDEALAWGQTHVRSAAGRRVEALAGTRHTFGRLLR
jgi:hypothetical protein